ncbi:hypothetical protein HDU96_001612 [Phlyctochytrium bullatum]|nr:hypothetical protein HDU96_001612 [Phlyctochytrium bullatum]
MAIYNDTAKCYYAQALRCGREKIAGFDIYAQVLALTAWLSVIMGCLALFLSIKLRQVRSSRGSEKKPLSIIAGFAQFEWFLFCYTLACLLNSVGLSLTAFVNTLSVVLYVLIGVRTGLVVLAFSIYIDLGLRTTTTMIDPAIERLRTLYLRLIAIPTVAAVTSFIYQGYLSDLTRQGGPDYGPGSAIYALFYRMITASNVLFYLVFLLLDLLVIVGKIRFSRCLSDMVEPQLKLQPRHRVVERMAPLTSPVSSVPPTQSAESLSQPVHNRLASEPTLAKQEPPAAPSIKVTFSDPSGPSSVSATQSEDRALSDPPATPASGLLALRQQRLEGRALSLQVINRTPSTSRPAADLGSAKFRSGEALHRGGAPHPLQTPFHTPTASFNGRLAPASSRALLRSPTLEIMSTINSAIHTMRWIAIGLSTYLVFLLFFLIVLLYLGEPPFFYFLNLAFSFWWPTAFGCIVFGVVSWHKARSLRKLTGKGPMSSSPPADAP